MRIMILANNDVGLYKFRKELVEQLCVDNEVYIVLPNGEYIKELTKCGCQHIPIELDRRGTNPFRDLLLISRYVKLVRKIQPKVVLTYTIKPNVYGGIACQLTHTSYIANVTGLGTAIENGGILSIVSLSLYRIGLKKASCVFFQNKENQKLFIEKRIVRGKNRLIPGSGVNLSTNYEEPYPDEDKYIRFLFVGRVMKDKGIEELLMAITEIHKVNRSVTADIVGWCDENYSERLKEAETIGAIRFHGKQSDVHTFYKNSHCVVLPSYHEGMANVMLEASATGRPVITTRVSGCRETFDEAVTGFGCEAGNWKSLVLAMNRFLNLSREKQIEMGKAARRKMEKEFDRCIVIDAYEEEIRNLGELPREV